MRFRILLSLILISFSGLLSAQEVDEKEFDLIEAAEKGNTGKVLTLLNDSINPNVNDYGGMTALHYATQNGHLQTVKALVLNGALVNKNNYEYQTPLHLAVHFNHLDIAEFLVQHEASINSRDQYGLSPLFYSSAYGDFIMTDMFLFYSKGESVTDPDGRTPFLAAVWGGHLANAELLLKYFAKVTETDDDENTALHLAVLNEDLEMIDSLLSWGCNLEAENEAGYTPLDLAILENNYNVIDHMVNSGADVNHKARRGMNSIDLVLTDTKNPNVIVLLEEAGAKRNKRIAFTQTAISTTFHTAFQDAFSVLKFEIWEPKYGIGVGLGASQRLGRIKVFSPLDDNTRYQFRETRTGFQAGIKKQFSLFRISRKNKIGMNLGVDAAYFIGHNKASEDRPSNFFTALPYTGIYWQSGSWQLGFEALYQDMKTYQLSDMRFGISVAFRFNEVK